MTISASDIEVGRCYVTGYSEMRRVIEADLNEVTYEVLGSRRREESPHVTVSNEKFAAEVDREIACPE